MKKPPGIKKRVHFADTGTRFNGHGCVKMVLLSARGARKVTNGRSRLVGCLLVSSLLAGKMGGVVSSALADRGGKGGGQGNEGKWSCGVDTWPEGGESTYEEEKQEKERKREGGQEVRGMGEA